MQIKNKNRHNFIMLLEYSVKLALNFKDEYKAMS